MYSKYHEYSDDKLKADLQRTLLTHEPLLDAKEVASRVERQLSNLKANDKQILRAMSEKVREHTESTGVLCLTTRENDSPMWGYYGDNHKGFCVGFVTDNLVRYVCANLGGIFTKINYTDELMPSLPAPSSDERVALDASGRFFSKHSQWVHENEHRYVKPNGIHLKTTFPPEAVDSVTFGYLMTSKDVARLAEASRRRYPHAKIRQAILVGRGIAATPIVETSEGFKAYNEVESHWQTVRVRMPNGLLGDYSGKVVEFSRDQINLNLSDEVVTVRLPAPTGPTGAAMTFRKVGTNIAAEVQGMGVEVPLAGCSFLVHQFPSS